MSNESEQRVIAILITQARPRTFIESDGPTERGKIWTSGTWDAVFLEERIHNPFVERATVEGTRALIHIGLRDVDAAVVPASQYTADEHFAIRLSAGLEDTLNIFPECRADSRPLTGQHNSAYEHKALV